MLEAYIERAEKVLIVHRRAKYGKVLAMDDTEKAAIEYLIRVAETVAKLHRLVVV